MARLRNYRFLLANAWLLAMPCAAAQAQGQVYLFGGSLLDNGNVERAEGFTLPGTDGIHFTNGPTYGEYLPGLLNLGFRASNGYAYGGATSGTINVISAFLPGAKALGLLQQITAATAAGVKFTKADLITVNAAQDDYIYATITGATTAPALETVSNNIATNLGTAVTQLHALGGDRFNVATPWDFYQSPDHGAYFNQNITPAVNQAVTQIISEMQVVHRDTGADIVVYNADLAVHQFIANPGAYGFSNVTDGCSTATGSASCAGGKASTYLFFNTNHPTTYADQIIAAQIANLELAPAEAASGVRLLAANTQLFDQAIRQHFGDTPPALGRVQLFALGLGSNGTDGALTRDGAQASFKDDYGIAGGALGIEATPVLGLTTGILAGATTMHGSSQEDLSGHAAQLGVFVAYNLGDWQMQAVAAYNWDSYGRISRPGVLLGNLSASPDGHGASVTGQVSRRFVVGQLNISPLAAFSYQDTSLDGYSEQGDALLAQHIYATRIADFFGDAGAQLQLPTLQGKLPLSSAFTVEVEHDFLGSDFTVNSYALSAPVGRSLAVPSAGRTYGRAQLALALPLTATITATGSLFTTAWRSDGNQHGAWLKLAMAF